MTKEPIPFLVADRPASLRVIKGSGIERFDKKLGIMSHANVSSNVQDLMRTFPCSEDCELSENCKFPEGVCKKAKKIRKRTVKMCDSGVFTKNGSKFESYSALFEVYDNMGTDYGIILDVLNNKDKTLKTARKAINTYQDEKHSFNLVGVAQGKNAQEYLECYEGLKEMGYDHIAIGGLLEKNNGNGKFSSVEEEERIEKVLGKIRDKYPKEWLFVLGCYHPSRHYLFKRYDVFGSDSKGWIFRYDKREDFNKEENRRWRYKQIRSFIRTNYLYNGFNKDMKKDKLLILSCSKSKKNTRKPIEAIRLYNGVSYKVLRNSLDRVIGNESLDVLILSAKHGLLLPTEKIKKYDKKLGGKEDIETMRRYASSSLENFLKYREYDEILLSAGKSYRKLIKGFENTKEAEMEIDKGRIGEKLSNLKSWLN